MTRLGHTARTMRSSVGLATVLFLAAAAIGSGVHAQMLIRAQVTRNIPYAEPAHERQVLDVYRPERVEGAPVVLWIHGGGWQTGDKGDIELKPQFFTERGLVFVSMNYRLLPSVEMGAIVADVARAVRWVHERITGYGGDPTRVLLMGHSAGAQLAALVCTDHRYLQAEGVPPSVLQGCVAVDGDTYDIPAIIETEETRRRLHGFPMPTFGHRQKFGDDPAKHRDFSAITHVARDKGIPPFLILHVAEHPDTSAQARRFEAALTEAGVPVTRLAARDTTHGRLNDDLGKPDDPATKALVAFLDEVLE